MPKKPTTTPPLPALHELPEDRFSHPVLHQICGQCLLQPKRRRQEVAARLGVSLEYVDGVIQHYYGAYL